MPCPVDAEVFLVGVSLVGAEPPNLSPEPASAGNVTPDQIWRRSSRAYVPGTSRASLRGDLQRRRELCRSSRAPGGGSSLRPWTAVVGRASRKIRGPERLDDSGEMGGRSRPYPRHAGQRSIPLRSSGNGLQQALAVSVSSPSGVPPALPGRQAKFDSSGNGKLPLVSRSKHHEREFLDELQEATAHGMGV